MSDQGLEVTSPTAPVDGAGRGVTPSGEFAVCRGWSIGELKVLQIVKETAKTVEANSQDWQGQFSRRTRRHNKADILARYPTLDEALAVMAAAEAAWRSHADAVAVARRALEASQKAQIAAWLAPLAPQDLAREGGPSAAEPQQNSAEAQS